VTPKRRAALEALSPPVASPREPTIIPQVEYEAIPRLGKANGDRIRAAKARGQATQRADGLWLVPKE